MGGNSLKMASINSKVNFCKISRSQEVYFEYSVKVLELLFYPNSGSSRDDESYSYKATRPKLQFSSLASQTIEVEANSIPSFDDYLSSIHENSIFSSLDSLPSSTQIEVASERNRMSLMDVDPSDFNILIEIIMKEDEDWNDDCASPNIVQEQTQSNSIIERNDSVGVELKSAESQGDFCDSVLLVMTEPITTFTVPADWGNMDCDNECNEYLATLRSQFLGDEET